MSLNQQQLEQDDYSLIAKICLKDKIALEQLYERYVDRMLGLANRILGNKSDAEEIVHDVFIEVWNKATTYNAAKASILGWMLLRVRSRCLDRLRKHQTAYKYIDKQKTELQIQSEIYTDTYIDHEFLTDALSVLSTKQRLIIELSYFKGFTCAEIASYYDLPLGTVKTRLLSAIKKMQTLFLKVKGVSHE